MDIFRGTFLLWRTPRLWGLALAPLLAAMVVYTLLGIGGGAVMIPLLKEWTADMGIPWLATVGFVVVWVFLFPFLFTLIGGAFAGVIFEPLSRAVEKTMRGDLPPTPETPLSPGAAFGDTMARLALSATLALLAFGFGFIAGVIPAIIAASILTLLDYSAPVYARRGKMLGAQWRDLIGSPDFDTATFALASGFVSLLPVIGVLMLPGMVAGATLLTLRREGRDDANR
ncbi:MAG: EI24 domain-containing protein [Armatimonadetes bacterium]|nr:EI24 domain-containing protein [Armatimonadota bacterium]